MAGKEPRPPTTTERMDAYQQAGQQAAQRREGLVDALRSGNQQQIDRAALRSGQILWPSNRPISESCRKLKPG